MFTPFAWLRGDIAAIEIKPARRVQLSSAPATAIWRAPCQTVGVEYRYPFINVEPWGTQTVEPIAQVILRPNETQIGKFPNEDAQSMVFSDSNLF